MKHLLLAAASLAVLTIGPQALAQDNHGGGDRHDGGARREGHNWSRGGRLSDQYRGDGYRMNDYASRGWRAPPDGYGYYRDDNGDVALAAITTGVIASVIANGEQPRYEDYPR